MQYTAISFSFCLCFPGGLRGIARGGLTGLTLTSLYALYNNWEHMKGSLLQQSLWRFCQLMNGGHFSGHLDHFIRQFGVILSLLPTISLKNWRFWFAVMKILDGWPRLALVPAISELKPKPFGWLTEYHGSVLLWRRSCTYLFSSPMN